MLSVAVLVLATERSRDGERVSVSEAREKTGTQGGFCVLITASIEISGVLVWWSC